MENNEKEKKEEKTELSEKDKEISNRKMEGQTKIMLIVMGIAILALVGYFWYASTKDQFNYSGLVFHEVERSNRQQYYTELEWRNSKGEIGTMLPLYFNQDPRTLERIPVKDEIVLQKVVAVAADKSFITGCNDSVYSAAKLSIEFLGSLGAQVYPATTNVEDAVTENATLVSCYQNAPYTIIEYERGNESMIQQVGNCYKLVVGNCEVLNVTERFMVAFWKDSKDNALSSGF